MKNILFSLLLMVSSLTGFACEVHLPHHIVILGDVVDLMKSSANTGCDEETLNEINATLISVEGKITSFQLAEMLKVKKQSVAIQPNLIQVQHFKHLVREQLLLPPGVQLRSSEAINSANFISLAPGDRVEVECTGCLYGSQQPLNLNIIGFDGSEKTMTVKGDFKKMVKAYRLLGPRTAFTEIKPEFLKEEYVESIPHTDLVTNLDTIHFFKLNKPVRSGELLKNSDLNALNLVKAGLKTEILIENKLVKLKTSGISRSNGILGQFVEVYSPEKNKKFQGKVIDINKVLIEL